MDDDAPDRCGICLEAVEERGELDCCAHHFCADWYAFANASDGRGR